MIARLKSDDVTIVLSQVSICLNIKSICNSFKSLFVLIVINNYEISFIAKPSIEVVSFILRKIKKIKENFVGY